MALRVRAGSVRPREGNSGPEELDSAQALAPAPRTILHLIGPHLSFFVV